MQKTKIGYLTHTYNPLAMRCTPISEGCRHCWHLGFADRHSNNPIFSKAERQAYAGGEIVLREKEIEAPLRLKKPARIGVQFMGDLFHPKVPFEFIDKIMAVIALCPQHDFQILSKREDRMLKYFTEDGQRLRVGIIFAELTKKIKGYHSYSTYVPLPNLHLGLTICNQKEADEKIPTFLQIQAAKRFLSLEPLLDEVLISAEHLPQTKYLLSGGKPIYGNKVAVYEDGKFKEGLDWVIIGCEKLAGNKAGRFNGELIRTKAQHGAFYQAVLDLINQCLYAGIPPYVKQIPLNGKVVTDINLFPKELQYQENVK